MKTADSDIEIRSAEVDTVPDYKQLSWMAIISLILAILSAAALAHPVLWVLPIIGIVVAIIARRRIASAEGEQRGEALANWGLVLSVLFGCWAVSWYSSYNVMLTRQAQVYGRQWLDLIKEGRLYEVHQLTFIVPERLSPGEPLAAAYAVPDRRQRPANAQDPSGSSEPSIREQLPYTYATFVGEMPLSKLLELGRSWEAKFVGTRSRLDLSQYATELQLEYRIHYTEKDRKRTMDVILVAERFCRNREAQWRISRIMEAKPS